MEIIELPGYINEEKVEIANRHLLPKQLKEHGVKKTKLSFSKDVINKIIEDYTRESGVRTLEKNIAKIIRNRAKFIVTKEKYNKKVDAADLVTILGPNGPRFTAWITARKRPPQSTARTLAFT